MDREMQTYFIQGPPFSPVKIGRAKDVFKRLQTLQCGTPHELRILRVLDGDREEEMHSRFSTDRIRGEWFRWSSEIEKFINEPLGTYPEVWSTINAYCSNAERRQFNEWRGRVYVLADQLRDIIRMWSTGDDRDYPKQIDELMKLVCECPYLMKGNEE